MAVWRLSRRFVFRLPGKVPKLALVPDDIGPGRFMFYQPSGMQRDQNPSFERRIREENQFLNARRESSAGTVLVRFQDDVLSGHKRQSKEGDRDDENLPGGAHTEIIRAIWPGKRRAAKPRLKDA
jgi:hypothetical protein